MCRIYENEGAKNPLDNTGVHPESYDICKDMLDMLGYSLSDVENKNISDIDSKVEAIGIKELSDKLQVGEVTLKDIIAEIKKPGRDPREEGIKPILKNRCIKDRRYNRRNDIKRNCKKCS